MADETKRNPGKPHYNITMSRRTRRPNNLKMEPCGSTFFDGKKCLGEEEKMYEGHKKDDHHQQKSLKERIEGRYPLAQYLEFKEEEKKQDLVIIRNENGVKFKNVVRHCVDVMSNLIKVKQDPPLGSRKKPIGPLKFVKKK